MQSSPLWQSRPLIAVASVPTSSLYFGLLQHPHFLVAFSWPVGQEAIGLGLSQFLVFYFLFGTVSTILSSCWDPLYFAFCLVNEI
jgi:hypothetical protein